MNGLAFLKTALGDHRIGAVTRSSPFVVDALIRALPPNVQYVMEYGSGDGVVTTKLLRVLPPDGRVVGIEQNAELVGELRRIVDGRFFAMHGDVFAALRNPHTIGLPRIDAVISAVPCTFLTPQQREEYVRLTHAVLAPSGRFIVYQYSRLMLPMLQKHFTQVKVSYVPLNFPPYFVMVAEKGGAVSPPPSEGEREGEGAWR
ncbi:methyltransferase domain-containing protein [Candidatus Uhrbacteria bacterium]|nr:methyltransferase domain-containing protein [Candidatus Uhrbacteria bacterium]